MLKNVITLLRRDLFLVFVRALDLQGKDVQIEALTPVAFAVMFLPTLFLYRGAESDEGSDKRSRLSALGKALLSSYL